MFRTLQRIADRTLLAMMPDTYVSSFSPSLEEQYTRLVTYNQTVFAEHTLPDGNTLSLQQGYRDFVKRSWRLAFPELAYLYNLRQVVELPADTQTLLDDILASPMLTVDLHILQTHVQRAAEAHPERTDVAVRVDGTEEYQFRHPEKVGEWVQTYRGAAQMLEVQLRRAAGRRLDGLAALEIGTGTGMLPFAVAERGARRSTGIDLEYAPTGWNLREPIIDTFGTQDRTELHRMDAQHTAFEDNTFDLIYSVSVLEHVADLRQTFHEMFRILKPGGYAIHSIGTYFGPAGGHALVTLDFPWGHVRLDSEDIKSYLRTHRPHEAERAIAFYEDGLTHPHHLLGDYPVLAAEAGFQLVTWREDYADHHRGLLTPAVLLQAREHYPALTVNDLLTHDLILTLKKDKVQHLP